MGRGVIRWSAEALPFYNPPTLNCSVNTTSDVGPFGCAVTDDSQFSDLMSIERATEYMSKRPTDAPFWLGVGMVCVHCGLCTVFV